MPYIKKASRSRARFRPDNAGELNYAITKLIDAYYHLPGNKNYQAINDIVGALDGAKLEFYHRVARKYEDIKWSENGDVYRSK